MEALAKVSRYRDWISSPCRCACGGQHSTVSQAFLLVGLNGAHGRHIPVAHMRRTDSRLSLLQLKMDLTQVGSLASVSIAASGSWVVVAQYRVFLPVDSSLQALAARHRRRCSSSVGRDSRPTSGFRSCVAAWVRRTGPYFTPGIPGNIQRVGTDILTL